MHNIRRDALIGCSARDTQVIKLSRLRDGAPAKPGRESNVLFGLQPLPSNLFCDKCSGSEAYYPCLLSRLMLFAFLRLLGVLIDVSRDLDITGRIVSTHDNEMTGNFLFQAAMVKLGLKLRALMLVKWMDVFPFHPTLESFNIQLVQAAHRS